MKYLIFIFLFTIIVVSLWSRFGIPLTDDLRYTTSSNLPTALVPLSGTLDEEFILGR